MHIFHILKAPFWPLVIFLELLIFMVETLNWLASPLNNHMNIFFLSVSLFLISLSILFWLNDITIEGVYTRQQTEKGTQSKRLRAIMLFVGFFWTVLAPGETINAEEYCLDIGKILSYVIIGTVLGSFAFITGLNFGAVIGTAQIAASVSKIDATTLAVAHNVVASINQSGKNVPVAVGNFLADSASTASPTLFYCLVSGFALFAGIIYLCSTIMELESSLMHDVLRNPDTKEITNMGFDLDLLTQYPILVIFLLLFFFKTQTSAPTSMSTNSKKEEEEEDELENEFESEKELRLKEIKMNLFLEKEDAEKNKNENENDREIKLKALGINYAVKFLNEYDLKDSLVNESIESILEYHENELIKRISKMTLTKEGKIEKQHGDLLIAKSRINLQAKRYKEEFLLKILPELYNGKIYDKLGFNFFANNFYEEKKEFIDSALSLVDKEVEDKKNNELVDANVVDNECQYWEEINRIGECTDKNERFILIENLMVKRSPQLLAAKGLPIALPEETCEKLCSYAQAKLSERLDKVDNPKSKKFLGLQHVALIIANTNWPEKAKEITDSFKRGFLGEIFYDCHEGKMNNSYDFDNFVTNFYDKQTKKMDINFAKVDKKAKKFKN